MTGIGIIDLFVRVFTRWIKSNPQTFHLPQRNTFLGLPPELLLYIVDYLPHSSTCLLALCSKSLWIQLSSKYMEELDKGKRQLIPEDLRIPKFTEHQEQRNTFLLLLERDFDDMVFCYFCQKLHKIYSYCRAQCRDKFRAWPSWPQATFSRLCYAMKCHRKGLNINHILDPLSRTLTNYQYKRTCQTIFKARVVSRSLYLRTQHWVLLPPKQPLELLTAKYLYPTRLCYHLHTFDGPGYMDLPFRQYLQEKFHEYQQLGIATHSTSTEQCLTCRTEFQIDIKDLGSRGAAVVITIWQDFGEILTPFDLTWKAHFFLYPSGPLFNLRRVPSFPQGSLKDDFEGGHFEFDAHQTKAEAAMLHIKNFRKPN